jgi:hypothetical protein
MPEISCFSMSSRARATSASGESVTGSRITPFALRFTWSTWRAWFSGVRLRWMIPMPPCRASAMARLASVTVSMAELEIGISRWTRREKRVETSTDVGRTSLRPGSRSRSSKVRPVETILSESAMEQPYRRRDGISRVQRRARRRARRRGGAARCVRGRARGPRK